MAAVKDSKSQILKKMMRSHDISHIIYGCNTTLLGEMQVQFWNQFGSHVPATFKDFMSAISDKPTRQIITPTGLIPFFLILCVQIDNLNFESVE